jgi:hypothetical protein
VLDQHPDDDLVREPDIGPGQAALGDLAAQHLEVLSDAGGQPVAELGIRFEPLELVVRTGHLERGPGDFRGARQRGGGTRVDQPGPAPHERHQEQLGLRVQVKRQYGALAVRLLRPGRVGFRGPALPAGHHDRDLQSVIEH